MAVEGEAGQVHLAGGAVDVAREPLHAAISGQDEGVVHAGQIL